MIKISVIIPTYKRYHTLNNLLMQLDAFRSKLHEIIVVDSTEPNERMELYPAQKLKYILNNEHKNGLFQRYVGYKIASGDWLMFFDNDMEIADGKFIDLIQTYSSQKDISGIAFRIIDKHLDTALTAIPQTVIKNTRSGFKKWFGWFTGYPLLKQGKFGLCGNRGKQPASGNTTEWLSGGAFACEKSKMFVNFNFQLFSLFQRKLGMGEDGLFGYCLSRLGKLIYINDLLFYHNDQKDSAYSSVHYDYAKRVLFSRLYLSYERQRLAKKSLLYAFLHYHWYALWRLMGLLMNLVADYSETRKKMLFGSVHGWMKTFGFAFNYHDKDIQKWEDEANKVITAYNKITNTLDAKS